MAERWLGCAGLLCCLALPGCRGEASAAAEAAAAPAAAGVAPAPSACGNAGMPDCPLQQWMKATLQSHQRSRDFTRLVGAFRELEAKAPPGYRGWAESAEAGALAAERRDEAGVSQSCKTCHDQHRTTFRRELRTQKLF